MLGGYSGWERCETMPSVRVSRVVEVGCGCNVERVWRLGDLCLRSKCVTVIKKCEGFAGIYAVLSKLVGGERGWGGMWNVRMRGGYRGREACVSTSMFKCVIKIVIRGSQFCVLKC